ncbi:potassium voltage-gated channel subfamily E member 4 isoform X2 [Lagenorhynchus albirostris]|uniref:potassium voltage-gated channel subfamily E member 4 isoform X2 n=1 Tax=Lagenorhynchus albirostris TaxID=27610 RepID=UPI0028E90EEE|nr:potassium voltage-gated channel subfamily E member 4 isoform X2 [Lagenorhynchus albirostris]
MSSLWNCEKDFSCLSPPVCGVCLSSPSKPVQSISGPWCIFWNLPFFHGGYTGHLPRLGGMASQGLLSSLDSGWVIQATLNKQDLAMSTTCLKTFEDAPQSTDGAGLFTMANKTLPMWASTCLPSLSPATCFHPSPHTHTNLLAIPQTHQAL